MKIGIFYGSTTGNTANAAEALKAELQTAGEIGLHNVADISLSLMSGYDLVILGTSTWGLGEMQDDWAGKELLAGVDLKGKKAAVFGMGDQSGFSDTYVDAMGQLAASAEKAGATLIGAWSVDGYDFSASAAVRNGMFVGLALDEDNQSGQTTERIVKWAAQLKNEMK